MSENRKFGVLAATRERAKALFRELGWEQGHDVAFSLSKWDNGQGRGIDLDVLLIDGTALPVDRDVWRNYEPCLMKRGGTAYALQPIGAAHIR